MGFPPPTPYFLEPFLNLKNDFGAKGNIRNVADAAITTATNILTSASAGFTAADGRCRSEWKK